MGLGVVRVWSTLATPQKFKGPLYLNMEATYLPTLGGNPQTLNPQP